MQHCQFHGPEEFLRGLNRKAAEWRIPLSGAVDLTHRCNLRCVHCYAAGISTSGELPTSRWIEILRGVAEAGCLHLLISGGEPLLRGDFGEIYREAKSLGMIVTLFTNGTLIRPEHLDLLEEMPPRLVEVTLYGATTRTYEQITGVRGSFSRCMEGIEALLSRGIRVGLKTVVMTMNLNELSEMEAIASGLGVKFRFDSDIFPRLNGDPAPLGLRVSPEAAVAEEVRRPHIVREWLEYKGRVSGPSSGRLYECGAGVTNFYIDPKGRVSPCLMTTHHRHPLGDGGFQRAWREEIPKLLRIQAPQGFPCRLCGARWACTGCAGFFQMESDREEVPSTYLCRKAQLRKEAIGRFLQGEKNAKSEEERVAQEAL